MRIYVAGPYTLGDQGQNIRAAVFAAEELLKKGHAPYIPHLNHLWHLIAPHSWETWLALDFAYLQICGALLRLPGVSRGADREVEFAEEMGVPVYLNVYDVPERVMFDEVTSCLRD